MRAVSAAVCFAPMAPDTTSELSAWIEARSARADAVEQGADVRLEVIPRSHFTPALFDALYALATSMSAEERANFENHAWTNDSVHLFRVTASGALAGFQFWCCRAAQPGSRPVILGGKLRVLPEHRRRALHLRSALTYYSHVLRTQPGERFERISLASLFGFVAIARALHDYRFLAEDVLPHDERWLCDVVQGLAADSGYRYERASGVVHVNIRPTAAQLASYPPDFFETALARAYRARNPEFRSNGCYLAFGFPLSLQNLQSIDAAIARKLERG